MKNLSEQGGEPTTNLTPVMRQGIDVHTASSRLQILYAREKERERLLVGDLKKRELWESGERFQIRSLI